MDFKDFLGGAGMLLDLGAGLLGLGDARKNRKLRQAELQMAQRQFDSQMDESVQRRVKDAQAAGIHPLFALGASVGASPTLSAGATPAPTGSAAGDALARIAERFGLIAQNKASARRDEAEAAFLDAQRKKVEGEIASRGRDALGSGGMVKTYPYPEDVERGLVEVVPPIVAPSKPGRPGTRAGAVQESIDAIMPDGRRLEIPNPDLGLDEISQFEYVRRKLNLHVTDQIEGIVDFWNAARKKGKVKRLEMELARLKRIRSETKDEREWRRRFEAWSASVRRWLF